MDALHGKVITYKQLNLIPERDKFLESDIYNKTDDLIRNGKPLYFMPCSITEMNIQEHEYDKAKYKIILFGVLLDGRRITVMLNDIIPYFDILVPDRKTEKDSVKYDIKEELKKAKDFEESIMLELNSHTKDNKYNNKKSPMYDPIKSEILSDKKPFKRYQDEKSQYVRIYFNKIQQRNAAIKMLRQKGYETASDDLSCYYRVVCRNYMTTFSNWVILSSYNITKNDNIKGPVFQLSIDDYKKYTGNILDDPILSKDNLMELAWDIETYSPDGDLPIPQNPEHKIFMISMVFMWYWSDNPILRVCLVDVPCDGHSDYLTIVCGNEKNMIKTFADLYSKLRPEFIETFNGGEYDWEWLMDRGASYTDVLPYFVECLNATIPWKKYSTNDIYDRESWSILKRKDGSTPKKRILFKMQSTKLEADVYADGGSLELPGYIDIDVRTVFRQLYPTSEKSSLSWFLSQNKLGGKEDMPYQEIFRIYRDFQDIKEQFKKIVQTCSDNQCDDITELLKILIRHNKLEDNRVAPLIKTLISLRGEMKKVASYCVVDSQRCHDLMKIRSIIRDRRELSDLSFTTLFDAFYRANGMKVRNIVIAHGQNRGILFTNIPNSLIVDEGKYPGAYVIPPKKGLNVSKLTLEERAKKAKIPITTPDFNKTLYQECAELSEEKLTQYKQIIAKYGATLDDKQIDMIETEVLKSTGSPLLMSFKEMLKEKIGRPITGLDFSSLYPSLIMTYNLSPECVILDVKKAKEMHKKSVKLHKISFEYNSNTIRGWSIFHENKTDPTKPDCLFGVYPMILKQLFDARVALKKDLFKYSKEKEHLENDPNKSDEYDEACFKYNCVDSKQKALKVLMNTFYGECGNKRSPFFMLQVAGGITSAGQYNIKMAKDFVEQKGCYVHYGDTDSLYISAPEHEFQEMDKEFYSGSISKLEYWTKMVKHTFKSIQDIQGQVNRHFITDNGTPFLKMAFEEVLMPMYLMSKKKYCGIAHENEESINFKPKNLFIRGLDFKKRGVSEIARKINLDILWSCMSMDNLSTPLELVEQKIHQMYNKKWDFDDFIMTDVYKPNKKNVKVQTFAARMKAEGNPLTPFERFTYIIAKKYPYYYDYRGRKIELSIGDKMELYDVAKAKHLTIDFDYYMTGSINGQLSRLIVYHPKFHVEPAIPDNDDEIDIAETKIYNNACKHIEQVCSKYYTTYKSKGSLYQNIFRDVNTIVGEKINKYHKDETITKLLKSCFPDDENPEKIEEWLCKKAETDALKISKNHGKTYVDEQLEIIKKEIKQTQTQKANNKNEESLDIANAKKERKTLVKKAKDTKINEMQKIYYGGQDSIIETRTKDFKNRLAILKGKIRDNINIILKLHKTHTNIITHLSDRIKKSLNIDNMFNEPNSVIPDYETLKSLSKKSTSKDNTNENEQNTKETLKENTKENKKISKKEKSKSLAASVDGDIDTEADCIIKKFVSNQTFKNAMTELKLIYANLISTYELLFKTQSIVEYLKELRNKKSNIIQSKKPVNELIKEFVKDTIAKK